MTSCLLEFEGRSVAAYHADAISVTRVCSIELAFWESRIQYSFYLNKIGRRKSWHLQTEGAAIRFIASRSLRQKITDKGTQKSGETLLTISDHQQLQSKGIGGDATVNMHIAIVNFQRLRPREKAKRLADLGAAAALIALTSPLMAIVALAIKCDSPGPVFYRQERIRLGGGRFIALMFRSTVYRSDLDHGALGVVEQAACRSRVGRFLRYSRIDNLPQLFNVVRGEMSVIDAGPECPHFLD